MKGYKTFVVDQKYQTNPLSQTPGTSTVFVKDKRNREIRIYKNIKNPWLYRKEILEKSPDLLVWYKK